MEIERKFLVNEKIYNYDLNKYEKKEIEQFYISYDPEIRYRKVVNNSNVLYYETRKIGRGFLREEKEIEVSKEVYENNLKNNIGSIIYKTRYLIPLKDNLICEVDFYSHKHKGLVTAEIEFLDENQGNNFTSFPEFFEKEVSGKFIHEIK